MSRMRCRQRSGAGGGEAEAHRSSLQLLRKPSVKTCGHARPKARLTSEGDLSKERKLDMKVPKNNWTSHAHRESSEEKEKKQQETEGTYGNHATSPHNLLIFLPPLHATHLELARSQKPHVREHPFCFRQQRPAASRVHVFEHVFRELRGRMPLNTVFNLLVQPEDKSEKEVESADNFHKSQQKQKNQYSNISRNKSGNDKKSKGGTINKQMRWSDTLVSLVHYTAWRGPNLRVAKGRRTLSSSSQSGAALPASLPCSGSPRRPWRAAAAPLSLRSTARARAAAASGATRASRR